MEMKRKRLIQWNLAEKLLLFENVNKNKHSERQTAAQPKENYWFNNASYGLAITIYSDQKLETIPNEWLAGSRKDF